jgi:hypothetical protein
MVTMEDFTLSAVDFAASAPRVTWQWSLTRPDGTFISDQAVDLDKAEWQYEACTDLYGWLEHYESPRRVRRLDLLGECPAWDEQRRTTRVS